MNDGQVRLSELIANEAPPRDDGAIRTARLNVGDNCTKQEMKLRFRENDDVIYHVKS